MYNKETDISKTVEKLKAWNEAYRLGKPIVSDQEYDQEICHLRSIDPNNEWLKRIEPTPVSASRKTKLPIPMKSLNKVKSLVELKQWAKSLALPPTAKLVITPKYDGISWLHDERTHTTYSRGGSENEGQDCSVHFNVGRFLENINLPVDYTFGELVFRRESWENNFVGKTSSATGEPYRSPRNTIAGFINRDEAPEEIRCADFVRYGIDERSLEEWWTYEDLITGLNREFSQYVNHPNKQADELYKTVTVQELTEDLLSDLFSQWRSVYYIDGLVLYINDLSLWKIIGRQQTSGNPLYAIAYKHPDFTEAFETTVKDINWNISKAGALKPVVNIEMVDTGDCSMENPTGYNASWIAKMQIAKGAKVLVTRSGGVIPKILRTIEPAPEEERAKLILNLIDCPHCGHTLEWDGNKVELCCVNPMCPGTKLAKIIFFFTTLGVENMGEETFKKLFDAGFCSISDILNISAKEILEIDGFGEGMVDVILSNNRKLREGVDLALFMQASDCFKGIGRVKAQKILDEMTEQEYYYFLHGGIYPKYPDENDLYKMPKTRQSFIRGVAPFYSFLSELNIPFRRHVQSEVTEGKYTGMSVCFSGVRSKELEDAITANGGKIASGVSKTTTHLIVKDPNGSSGKINKAKELGIPILTIDTFLQTN